MSPLEKGKEGEGWWDLVSFQGLLDVFSELIDVLWRVIALFELLRLLFWPLGPICGDGPWGIIWACGWIPSLYIPSGFSMFDVLESLLMDRGVFGGLKASLESWWLLWQHFFQML